MTQPQKMTHEEWRAEAVKRFGENPRQWAFVCPTCGDEATFDELQAALDESPRRSRTGDPLTARDIAGQECIGRTTGAGDVSKKGPDSPRGCNWAAFGLFRGPYFVVMEDGHEVATFGFANPKIDAPESR